VFWCANAVGLFLSIASFLLAWPTAWLFDDVRLVPVTELIGMLFIISALSVVQNSLLIREFELRKVAAVNLAAVLVSSILSVVLAKLGYGVYTLIWTNISQALTRTVAFFIVSRWRPSFHFNLREVLPYLRYGMYVAFSGTFQRLFQTVDKLIVGKFFGASRLGIYEEAMTLANMPLDKIWPIYQQVAFPLFSRLTSQADEVYRTYLAMMRHYLVVVGPIYLGAAVTAPELVGAVLGDKWLELTPWFQAFCLVKLCETIASYHSAFFNATGRQRQVTPFHLLVLIVIPLAILAAAFRSFDTVLLPWLTLYPLMAFGWIVFGLKKNGLSLGRYLLGLWDGLKASFVMALVLLALKTLVIDSWHLAQLTQLLLLIALGAITFGLFLLAFQRRLIDEAINTLVRKKPPTPEVKDALQ
jgi:O-antigen/teichoic acid export membrane protein